MNNEKTQPAAADVRRDYKDTMFRMIFKEKENLLSLYNAMSGTAYTNAADLEIVTLENAVYMNVKNDVAFVIDMRLNLYEHQSTFSKNLPLRNLIYVAKELQGRVKPNELYRSKLVKIPTPGFVVFYNGKDERPKKQILKLSDAYEHSTDDPELELKVTVLNINPGKNDELLEKCQMLREYMLFVGKVRKYAEEMELADAVNQTVDECIRENILKEFLVRNRNEAVEVCIFEYNEEEALEYIRKDERAEGHAEGRAEGRAEGENRLGRLITALIDDGKNELVAQVASDAAIREEYYKKYHIEQENEKE